MVNMKIFKTLLEAAYNLDVVHFHTDVDKFYSNENGHCFTHKCDINTNDGGLHITLHESHFEGNKYINAEIKTSIKSYTKESVVGLVKSQLETESFLMCEDYNLYSHDCELIK